MKEVRSGVEWKKDQPIQMNLPSSGLTEESSGELSVQPCSMLTGQRLRKVEFGFQIKWAGENPDGWRPVGEMCGAKG